jgi:hypothetical protein
MHLVASKPLKLVGVERLAERLLADQRAVGQLLLPVLEPRQHLAFEEAAQALDIGGGRLFAISEFIWIAPERVRPPGLCILTQRRQRGLLGIVALGPEQFERTAGHNLVFLHFGDVLVSVCRSGADGIDDAFGLASGVEMNQRHLYRLAVGRQRSLQPAPVSGSLSEAKPPLGPQDAGDLLDEVLLCRPLRTMLGHQRLDNRPVFVGVLPWQDRVARQHPGPRKPPRRSEIATPMPFQHVDGPALAVSVEDNS